MRLNIAFFKRVVRHAHSFRNIILSLSVKHQMMIAYHLHDSKVVQPSLQVTKLAEVDLTVLREDIKGAVEAKYPGKSCIHLANAVCYSGTTYTTGMILANGSKGGLPDFGELIQVVVVDGKPGFIVKCFNAWYIEHLGSYELENTSTIKVLEPAQLSDIFPLVAYTIAGKRMVTLKRYIYLP